MSLSLRNMFRYLRRTINTESWKEERLAAYVRASWVAACCAPTKNIKILAMVDALFRDVGLCQIVEVVGLGFVADEVRVARTAAIGDGAGLVVVVDED